MKFGKIADISDIDFRLPPDPPETSRVLKRFQRENEKLNVYLGCTGWAMKEWVGKVYPSGTKSKDYLRQYALQFNTIELNTTHYRIPDPATIDRWRTEATMDFRFCPKVPQSISHSGDLGLNGTQINAFCNAVLGLEERLGCCFIQLPPYFGFGRLSLLRQFLEEWPRTVPLAVELRHESWFDQESHRKQCFELLERTETTAVLTDVAGRRDVLHMHCCTGSAMIRFVGNGLHPSDYSRIDAWVKRLNTWKEKGLQQVYFFTHEPDNILAPELAAYLSSQLAGQERLNVRGPKMHDENAGNQMRLF